MKGMPLIALTFSESDEILFIDILYPENISLPLFVSKPDFRILFKTCSERTSNQFRVDPHLDYSLPLHNPLLFHQCPLGKLHLYYVSHKVNA